MIYAVNLAERDFVTTCLMRAYLGSENVWIRAEDNAFNAKYAFERETSQKNLISNYWLRLINDYIFYLYAIIHKVGSLKNLFFFFYKRHELSVHNKILQIKMQYFFFSKYHGKVTIFISNQTY